MVHTTFFRDENSYFSHERHSSTFLILIFYRAGSKAGGIFFVLEILIIIKESEQFALHLNTSGNLNTTGNSISTKVNCD